MYKATNTLHTRVLARSERKAAVSSAPNSPPTHRLSRLYNRLQNSAHRNDRKELLSVSSWLANHVSSFGLNFYPGGPFNILQYRFEPYCHYYCRYVYDAIQSPPNAPLLTVSGVHPFLKAFWNSDNLCACSRGVKLGLSTRHFFSALATLKHISLSRPLSELSRELCKGVQLTSRLCPWRSTALQACREHTPSCFMPASNG